MKKAFRDRGSGFVVMKLFIDWHKKYIEWWKRKLKIIDYKSIALPAELQGHN